MSEENKWFNSLPPKVAFFVGIVGGILVLCTVGFFVLGGIMVKGGAVNLAFNKNQDNAAEAADNNAQAPTDTAPDVANLPPPPVTADDHIRGKADAPVTLIEYSDFECPFCKRFHDTMKQVEEAYPDKVKWVYRHFPLSFHANAGKEAEASECAAELGGNEAFWRYTDAIYERTTSNGTGFALDQLVPLAKEMGLEETAFRTCLDSGKYAAKIQEMLSGGTDAGITGTPGTIVLGPDGRQELIPGALPFESIKQLIDSF